MERRVPKTSPLKLNAGEQIIMQSQGAYKHNPASGWKIAHAFLTNRRLVIFLGRTVKFEIALKQIKDLAVERTYFVIRTKECLCISYESQNGPRRYKIWFLANDIQKWRKTLYQLSLLKIDSAVIEKIAAQADTDSRDILWYLWENRHARIDTLAEIIDAPNHMYVLVKIRETINAIAEKMIGCPILSFERSKVDLQTGEVVLFSWWLTGQPEEGTRSKERLLDIFDEGSHIQVIIEVRVVKKSDVRLDVSGNELTVRFEKDGSTLKEVINLPAGIKPDGYQMHLKNNLLEIKLPKSNPDRGERQLARGQ